MERNAMVRITGLWMNTSKAGEQFLSGSLTPTARILIFRNKKEKKNEPDFVVFLVPNGRKESPKQDKSKEETVSSFLEDPPSEDSPF